MRGERKRWGKDVIDKTKTTTRHAFNHFVRRSRCSSTEFLLASIALILLTTFPCHSNAQELLAVTSPQLPTVPDLDPKSASDLSDQEPDDSQNNESLDSDDKEEEDLGLDDELDSLLDQDLTSLRRTSVAPSLDMEVSSVSRQKSTIGRSPAAIFVITQEMIRRSGYRSIPELLRLAPGLQVARIDGNKWSVSSRGEAGRFSEKLLVQIDGRSVYNPLFAGVIWDVQDVLLEDILRIEIIRGPGATVWGANAVNGVINVITKSSADTHGSYAQVGGGSMEQGFMGARIGGQTESGINYRAWGKWYQRDDLDLTTDEPFDATKQGHAGFRSDWNANCQDSFTLQGQYYKGESSSLADRDFAGRVRYVDPVEGGNLLARWTRSISDDRESSLQMYYTRTDRETFGFGQQTNIFDLDYQNRFRWHCDHSVIWGLGYRAIFDKLTNQSPLPYIAAIPERRTVQWFSGFIQDEVTLIDDSLYLTIGSKFSHNTYSNYEVQPSLRMLWLPSESEAAWCAVSRAVRTPSRLSSDGQILVNQPPPALPFPLYLRGNSDARAENLLAFEVGYRQQTSELFSWDATAYFNDYSDMHTIRTQIPAIGFPYTEIFNGGSADGYGFEVSATARLTDLWSLRGWYTFQRINYDQPPPAQPSNVSDSGLLPRNQISLTNSFDLQCGRQLDFITRYVDNLPAGGIPSYFAFDARFSCNLSRTFSASIVGRNLLDRRHPEFGSNQFTGDVATEVPRSIHAYLEWRR